MLIFRNREKASMAEGNMVGKDEVPEWAESAAADIVGVLMDEMLTAWFPKSDTMVEVVKPPFQGMVAYVSHAVTPSRVLMGPERADRVPSDDGAEAIDLEGEVGLDAVVGAVARVVATQGDCTCVAGGPEEMCRAALVELASRGAALDPAATKLLGRLLVAGKQAQAVVGERRVLLLPWADLSFHKARRDDVLAFARQRVARDEADANEERLRLGNESDVPGDGVLAHALKEIVCSLTDEQCEDAMLMVRAFRPHDPLALAGILMEEARGKSFAVPYPDAIPAPKTSEEVAEAVGRCAAAAVAVEVASKSPEIPDEILLAEAREETLALLEHEADELKSVSLVASDGDLGPDPVRALYAEAGRHGDDVDVIDDEGDLVVRTGDKEVVLRAASEWGGFDEAEPLEPAFMLGYVDSRRAPSRELDEFGPRMIRALDGIGDEGRAALLGYVMGLGNPSLGEQARTVGASEPTDGRDAREGHDRSDAEAI